MMINGVEVRAGKERATHFQQKLPEGASGRHQHNGPLPPYNVLVLVTNDQIYLHLPGLLPLSQNAEYHAR
jgi:hypothetical protein